MALGTHGSLDTSTTFVSYWPIVPLLRALNPRMQVSLCSGSVMVEMRRSGLARNGPQADSKTQRAKKGRRGMKESVQSVADARDIAATGIRCM